MSNSPKKIYFAAPLFSAAERNFNKDLTIKLENLGFSVFLPQRDGVEKGKAPYDEMDPDLRRKTLFELDRDRIIEADIFLFVLDGRVPDEGACVELGIAYSWKYLQNIKKKIFGLHTDDRAAFISSKLNPMLKCAFDEIYENEEDLLLRFKTMA